MPESKITDAAVEAVAREPTTTPFLCESVGGCLFFGKREQCKTVCYLAAPKPEKDKP